MTTTEHRVALSSPFPVERLASFADGNAGGNPAGVVICEALPDAAAMQAIAAEVGYSETAFAAPLDGTWRVRYFAPEIEVPFCGHATIALGAALARREGDGLFHLRLNQVEITVEGRRDGATLVAALQSPPTHSEPAPPDLVRDALVLFGYTQADLDPRLPPAIAEGGAKHLVLALATRTRLSEMHYDLDVGRELMLAHGFATIALVYAEHQRLFHARNPFAAGGVYEDPATGAAAAALAGYLRDARWLRDGAVDIIQGEDMGMPSRIHMEIPPEMGSSIRVSGAVRSLD
ncbi:PhzF family phenazine biosynthesis protein [Paraburkholderia megapolitana]|uniref:Phenazine biosynthesis protein PhzF family n=1 Tax=Paraburkholderia megapolitana TaxID=420953 RepID=A0A1I3GK77_9BURK|nr:PhzF family phenazine biosynthesis protein [Paraburkholderia megapolitana]QDQ82927.1 PhzF family phenazine biosynthesis protein [Paraburkholderia megapolitana]SFI23602.1 phenazine biosynthesis protein PhzF family [Paraburkholderia megapolitana]